MNVGYLAFELFEESPRVGRILEIKNNVLTMEVTHGYTMAHISNFRLATEEEIVEADQLKQQEDFYEEHSPKATDFI